MLRVIHELQPVWIVGENVPGITKIALDDILDSIEAEGYSERTYSYPASIIGACHKRERIFIVAHDNKSRCNDGESGWKRIYGEEQTRDEDWKCDRDVANTAGVQFQGQSSSRSGEIGYCNTNAPDMHVQRLQRGNGSEGVGREPKICFRLRDADAWPEIATLLCGVDDGIPEQLDRLGIDRHTYGIPSRRNRTLRLKALGNSVVPQQVYPILKAIADIERGR